MSAVAVERRFVGQSMRRKEDPRLITGHGNYVDDIALPGMLWATVVRSSEAHARIRSIDVSGALAQPGVEAAFTGQDLASDFKKPLPSLWAPSNITLRTPEHWPLARDEVRYVGDAVGVLIGDDPYRLADAAALVSVDYEPLPAVTDPERALAPDAPLVHAGLGTNQVHDTWAMGSSPQEVQQALRESDVVVDRRIVNHRMSGAPMEPRGVIASWQADHLTLWSATQVPHILRNSLAAQIGVPEDAIRVIAPDVGGGFGSKLNVYPEEALIAIAARKVGRPVKWIETRSETMMSTAHGRDQIDYVTMGAKLDGTITALAVRVIADEGAYLTLLTPIVPVLGMFIANGVYNIPVARTELVGVFTNKMATDAVRGAGRPEAIHLVETMIDQVAAELEIDPITLRRRNYIRSSEFPFRTPLGLSYDSGNYEPTLDRAVEMIDATGFRKQQAELRRKGIYRGLGISSYVEIAGLAPSRFIGPKGIGLKGGLWESSLVRVHPSGSITVFTGCSPHGQGHETSFSQIMADRLGATPDQVRVLYGDTDTGPYGLGTYGSRTLSVGGEAAARAADKVADKARQIAAHMLEAAPGDIELRGGKYGVKGVPGRSTTLADIAGVAHVAADLPDGTEPGLEAEVFYDPSNFVFPFGTHACIVEVDAQTGKVSILRWVAVDDCGVAVNPMLVEGQVHGGITHAIGQALYEQIVYSPEGQLTSGTFVDYTLPTASDVPLFEVDRTETPSPVNELQVKGVGEAGTIPATAALVNAVVDALRPLGITFLNMPLSMLRVHEAIEAARQKSAPAVE